ncbi:MAG: hypothetical protein CVV28_09690 [Methanobacteriales archaeon HGW-Methanobacteriales-1]|jgi:hypothetical protein|nr:MAG: hypothetical protein CVV28_09690 [Methanobacteriales archaeon HGW-Methanobacteriales-1]
MSNKKRRFLDSDEEDPTSGIINLTDCMLVLAVGFLVFAIMSLGSNSAIISDTTGSTPNTVSVTTGKVINDTNDTSSGSGSGYQEMGTVYKDPKTGKLIMVK